jgi:hypothetical protein
MIQTPRHNDITMTIITLLSDLKNRFKHFFDSIIGHFSVAAVLSLLLLIAGVMYDGNFESHCCHVRERR